MPKKLTRTGNSLALVLDRPILEATGIDKEKILKFLQADPDGKGSVQDQVTAEMTTELMNVMGISGQQTATEVKRIRVNVDKDSD
jgi:hypothetical protein